MLTRVEAVRLLAADCCGFLAPDTAIREKLDFLSGADTLRVVTPEATEGAPLEEDGRADPGPSSIENRWMLMMVPVEVIVQAALITIWTALTTRLTWSLLSFPGIEIFSVQGLESRHFRSVWQSANSAWAAATSPLCLRSVTSLSTISPAVPTGHAFPGGQFRSQFCAVLAREDPCANHDWRSFCVSQYHAVTIHLTGVPSTHNNTMCRLYT